VKRTATGVPYLSFCLIVRNCEKTLPGVLEQCLQSVRARAPQAEIVIVDTRSSDATPEVAQRYADVYEEYKGPRGDWTKEMGWFDDAAAARQRSFELAHGKWRAWIDADDILPGPQEVQRLLELNGQVRKAPEAGYRDMAAPAAVEPRTLEGVLSLIEHTDATIDCINAPYLYRSDAEGKALIWQVRERIVKWEAGWRWVEPGHEVLVPTNGRMPHQLDLPTLLYVHLKKWTDEDQLFSTRRHFGILMKKYEDGDRSLRTLQYLCSFAPSMAPERHGEFVREALATAVQPMERYFARLCAGGYDASRGLYHDALEHLAAAKVIVPHLPNAYLASAEAAAQAEDWERAAADYQQALNLRPDYVTFPMPCREFSVRVPLKAATALQHLADTFIKQGRQQGALEALGQALRLAEQALSVASGQEELELTTRCRDLAKQLFEAQEQALQLHKTWDFLRRHDETAKILDLLKAVPYLLEDHPIVQAIQAWAKPLRVHLHDEKAYGDFYNHMDQELAIPTHLIQPAWQNPENALPRVRELIQWILANKPDATILELGPYDGIVVLPVLKACPRVRYTAVDANQDVLDRLMGYATEAGVADRLTLHLGTNTNIDALYKPGWPACPPVKFDIVGLFEVIEHVQRPVVVVTDLLEHLKPDGMLFMSTPWGGFDIGAPDESTRKRDPRGHVRAMLPSDMVRTVEAADGRVHHLANCAGRFHYGDTMHVRVKHSTGDKRPIAFVVPSALWEWNASKVINTGMGMSEEAIVYLARELAKDPAQPVAVYGPVPEEEVNDGVQYWSLEKLRHLPRDAKVIVSRCPGFLRHVEAVTGNKYPDAVLWLQDTTYPDLNAETAALYEKVVVLTKWHRDLISTQGVPDEKMVQINNFLLHEHFMQNGEVFRQADWAPRFEIPRKPHHFVYASSPDRGLVTLLRLWPEVLKAYSDATLSIFYGWEGCMKLSAQNPGWASIYKKLRADYEEVRYQPGVVERGRVTHRHLAAEMMQATGLLYPVSFLETGCATIFKVQAAGAVGVTTPSAGLRETGDSRWTQWIEPDPNDSYVERFMAGVKYAVELPYLERVEMAHEAIRKYELRNEMLPRWKDLLGVNR